MMTDRLSHHPFLAPCVSVMWSSSWKSRSPKAVILRDAYPDVQPLWMAAGSFYHFSFTERQHYHSMIEVLVGSDVYGVHVGQFLLRVGL